MSTDLNERLALDAGFIDDGPLGLDIRYARLIALVAEECAKVCESAGALEAMDGEEVGSAAMVRVADRQVALCAAAIRAKFPKPWKDTR